MICQKCSQAEYEETVTQFRIECQNRLFNFDNVPAKKCPECGHIFIPETSMRPILVRTQKINQLQGIAYHRTKWSAELEEEAVIAEQKNAQGGVLDSQKKTLAFIEKNKKRVLDQKTTKKNILKLFKWNFDQETGIKKDFVINEIIDKIRDKHFGIFTFSCKAGPSSPFDTLDYALLVTEENSWFYCSHDPKSTIYHLI